MSLDAVPQKASIPASSDTCPAHLGQESLSFIGATDSSEHDTNTVGQDVVQDLEAMQESVGCLDDRDREGTSTLNSTNAGWMRTKGVETGLLGESGQAIKAAHAALEEIEDVHSSDELMHFELCGPFWELSEV
jgi:hypothetical protein